MTADFGHRGLLQFQDDLPACLSSIKRQSYSKLEIIVVENGTSDSRALVESIASRSDLAQGAGECRVRGRQQCRPGGCARRVDRSCEPDARLDDECLLELLHAFRLDGNLAVAAPKTRFWTRFVDVHLESDAAFSISSTELESQLNYKKFFVRQGRVDGGSIESRPKPVATASPGMSSSCGCRWTNPVRPSRRRLERHHDFHRGRRRVGSSACEGSISLLLCLRSQDHPGAGWVINNAGTGLRREGTLRYRLRRRG